MTRDSIIRTGQVARVSEDAGWIPAARSRGEYPFRAAILLLLAVGCARAHEPMPVKQAPPPASDTKGYAAVIGRALVPAQDIDGVVLNAKNGRGIANAHLIVFLKDSHRRAGRPVEDVLTDANGRFEVSVPDTGVYEFHARLSGFRTISRDIHVGPVNGIEMVIRLAENPLRLCHLVITNPHSVAVRVVDAITGAPITTGASLEIVDGRYRAYANSGDPAPAGMSQDSSLLVAGDRMGKFEVIVRKPHYEKWRARGVTPTSDECGMHAAELIAQMIPDP